MRYLLREGAPLSHGQWEQIDGAVVAEAAGLLVARRFLDVKILGARTQSVALDRIGPGGGAGIDYWGRGEGEPVGVESRRMVEVPTLYADFSISWRDVEQEDAGAQAARGAALAVAKREDDLIFNGDKALGIEGILTAAGVTSLPLSDWNDGEAPVRDIAKAIEALVDSGNAGAKALVVSTDLHAQLHRIQPGTGMMEVERVRSLVGKVFVSPCLAKNTACLVYCDARNIDIAVGQDVITAYLGNEQLDHVFRVMETVVPRMKNPRAVAVLR